MENNFFQTNSTAEKRFYIENTESQALASIIYQGILKRMQNGNFVILS